MAKRVDLIERYKAELRSWNWGALRRDAQANVIEEYGCDPFGSVYIGSVLNIMPSGKLYAPWTTNQTSFDVARDYAFATALEAIAEEHDMFLGGPDSGDGCDMFLSCNLEIATD